MMKLNKLILSSALLLSSSHVLATPTATFFGKTNANESPVTINPKTSIERISLDKEGAQLKDESDFLGTDWPVMSRNGQYVAFTAADSSDANDGYAFLYVKNLQTKVLRQIDRYKIKPCCNESGGMTRIVGVSNDGNKVLMLTTRDLTGNDKNKKTKLYLKNISENTVTVLDKEWLPESKYGIWFEEYQYISKDDGFNSKSIRFNNDETLVYLSKVKPTDKKREYKISLLALNLNGQTQHSKIFTVQNAYRAYAIEFNDINDKGEILFVSYNNLLAEDKKRNSLFIANADLSKIERIQDIETITVNGNDETPYLYGPARFAENGEDILGYVNARGYPFLLTKENLKNVYRSIWQAYIQKATAVGENVDINKFKEGQIYFGGLFKKSRSSKTFEIIDFITYDSALIIPKGKTYNSSYIGYVNGLSKDGRYLYHVLEYYLSDKDKTPESELIISELNTNTFERIPLGTAWARSVQFSGDSSKIMFPAFTNKLVKGDTNVSSKDKNLNAGDVFTKNFPLNKNTLTVTPSATDVSPFENKTISVSLNMAAFDLYGLQVTCSADKAVIQLQSAEYGDLFAGKQSYNVPINVDTGSNTFSGSSLLFNPEEPITSEGTFATLTYAIPQTTGKTDVACIAKAADKNGKDLKAIVITPTVRVNNGINSENGVNITGKAKLQFKAPSVDESGLMVKLKMGPAVLEQQTLTGGQFTFEKIRDGQATLAFQVPTYVKECQTINIGSAAIDLKNVRLSAGDVAGNNEGQSDETISMADLSFVAGKYNSKKGEPRFDAKADINFDEVIDIYDLTTIAGNYGETNCKL